MKSPLLFFLFLLCIPFTMCAQVGVGQWRDHLPYRDVEHIVDVGDKIFAATEVSMFSLDKSSGEVERYNKVNGLSDVRISALEYDAGSQTLIVGYANGNLDLLSGDRITNLSDIKRSDIVGDKGIFDIHMKDGVAWLSTGFGIVLIDVEREEVADTYLIAPDAAALKVNAVEFYQGQVFAATDAGLRIVDENANLADFNQWSWDDSLSQEQAYGSLLSFDDELFMIRQDDGLLLRLVNGEWVGIPGYMDLEFLDITSDGTTLTLTERYAIRFLDASLTETDVIVEFSFPGGISLNTAILTSQGLYAGDDRHGLVDATTDGTDISIVPNGPFAANSWKMTASDGRVWVAHGGVKSNWDNRFINDQSSGLIDGQWVSLKGTDGLATVRDHLDLIVPPNSPNELYINSWNQGLVRYDVSTFTGEVLNSGLGNAAVSNSLQNPNRYQTAGSDFDADGNLWVTNSYTEAPLKALTPEGEWELFSCAGELTTNSLLGQIVCGQGGVNWVVLPRFIGLFAYDTNGTLSDRSDDDCKMFSQEAGDGGLPTASIFSVAEDLDGEIWIGTSEGPAVNYSPTSIFSSDPLDFQQILVEQDGNVEILLGNEIITDIEIDGANRKWFGTQGAGAFLISEDGGEQIYHFDTENSPLLNDEIRDITIEPTTGEVFFATDNGIVSFRGEATDSRVENECISVFPNPVREDYSGPITMDGLVGESEVKITDVAGNIVFQTRANGGRAVWDGTDFSGSRVQTGVYFAHSVSRDGESACTSKILLIN